MIQKLWERSPDIILVQKCTKSSFRVFVSHKLCPGANHPLVHLNSITRKIFASLLSRSPSSFPTAPLPPGLEILGQPNAKKKTRVCLFGAWENFTKIFPTKKQLLKWFYLFTTTMESWPKMMGFFMVMNPIGDGIRKRSPKRNKHGKMGGHAPFQTVTDPSGRVV